MNRYQPFSHAHLETTTSSSSFSLVSTLRPVRLKRRKLKTRVGNPVPRPMMVEDSSMPDGFYRGDWSDYWTRWSLYGRRFGRFNRVPDSKLMYAIDRTDFAAKRFHDEQDLEVGVSIRHAWLRHDDSRRRLVMERGRNLECHVDTYAFEAYRRVVINHEA